MLILPHPEREAPEVRRLQPNAETEAIAMRVVIDYETAQGRQVYDIHDKNLGYDITSLDLNSGELRLIEVKRIGDATGNRPPHAERTPSGQGSARLLLALRRDRLRHRTAASDPDQGSSPPLMA